MTGSLAGVLPSPGATAMLANSPQAHEQAHAVAVAAMAQLSPQLGSQLLQHQYAAHATAGHGLLAPRHPMSATSPPQTVPGAYGAYAAPSAASYGGGGAWGQTRGAPPGGAARFGSPQPSELMQQSVVGGGGGESSMFSPPEPAASGLQHSSGSAAEVNLVQGDTRCLRPAPTVKWCDVHHRKSWCTGRVKLSELSCMSRDQSTLRIESYPPSELRRRHRVKLTLLHLSRKA